MKRSTLLSYKLFEATIAVLDGKANPLHLKEAVRASNGLIRLALGDSFHQRMRKEKPYVEFFDEEISGTKDLRPLVVPLAITNSVKPQLNGKTK